ncbi:MAG: AzlC family ABC transporter permease [Clostridia bacterium]|jgi:predicted branched-subunit amino acid permease|nr:AzlC family ABC transporter permease [Clostridia bacterium]
MKAGIPIAMGYFAVAIALGIAAVRAGVGAFAAAFASLLNNASAGEYIAFTLIAAGASYMELITMEAVANARYLLMSAALSQKLKAGTSTLKRLLLGFTVTDEIFGVSMMQEGYLNPYFTYGAFVVATTGWTGGTLLGALMGDILPASVVTALSVGLYGMFISVFVPEAKKNRIVALLVLVSFVLSAAFEYLPYISTLSSGLRVIILTVVISLGAALLFPIKEESDA